MNKDKEDLPVNFALDNGLDASKSLGFNHPNIALSDVPGTSNWVKSKTRQNATFQPHAFLRL